MKKKKKPPDRQKKMKVNFPQPSHRAESRTISEDTVTQLSPTK
jgi:hypothetical protein